MCNVNKLTEDETDSPSFNARMDANAKMMADNGDNLEHGRHTVSWQYECSQCETRFEDEDQTKEHYRNTICNMNDGVMRPNAKMEPHKTKHLEPGVLEVSVSPTPTQHLTSEVSVEFISISVGEVDDAQASKMPSSESEMEVKASGGVDNAQASKMPSSESEMEVKASPQSSVEVEDKAPKAPSVECEVQTPKASFVEGLVADTDTDTETFPDTDTDTQTQSWRTATDNFAAPDDVFPRLDGASIASNPSPMETDQSQSNHNTTTSAQHLHQSQSWKCREEQATASSTTNSTKAVHHRRKHTASHTFGKLDASNTPSAQVEAPEAASVEVEAKALNNTSIEAEVEGQAPEATSAAVQVRGGFCWCDCKAKDSKMKAPKISSTKVEVEVKAPKQPSAECEVQASRMPSMECEGECEATVGVDAEVTAPNASGMGCELQIEVECEVTVGVDAEVTTPNASGVGCELQIEVDARRARLGPPA